MKTNNLFFAVLVILTILPITYASMNFNSVVQPICNNGVCLEGSNAIWRIKVNNLGDQPIEFTKISLRDDKNLVFASKAFKKGEFVLSPNKYQIIDLPGFVPAPTKGSLVYYQTDFDIGGKTYSENIKAVTIMPLSEIQCLNNDFCNEDELCVGYRCVPESFVNTTNMTIKRTPKKVEFKFNDIMQIVNAIILLSILVMLLRKKRWKK